MHRRIAEQEVANQITIVVKMSGEEKSKLTFVINIDKLMNYLNLTLIIIKFNINMISYFL